MTRGKGEIIEVKEKSDQTASYAVFGCEKQVCNLIFLFTSGVMGFISS